MTASMLKRKIGGLLAAAVVALGAIPALPAMTAHAEDIYPGEYTVTVVPTYQNPDTGAVEDTGQNPGIGQMMVQAQQQSVGYVQITDDGTIYLNIRLNLADSNIYTTFSTSSDGSSSWTQRDFEVTNQAAIGDYEFMGQTFSGVVTDFRFEIGTLNDTVRCTNYVEAMGREVVWFCYITDLTEGVGDSWTTIQTPDMSDYTEQISQMEEAAGTSSSTSSGSSSSGTTTTKKSGTSTEGIKDRDVKDAKTTDASDEDTDEDTGIVGLGSSDKKSSKDSSGSGLGTMGTVLLALGCAAVGGGIVGGVMYAQGRKRKNYQDLFPDVDDKDSGAKGSDAQAQEKNGPAGQEH